MTRTLALCLTLSVAACGSFDGGSDDEPADPDAGTAEPGDEPDASEPEQAARFPGPCRIVFRNSSDSSDYRVEERTFSDSGRVLQVDFDYFTTPGGVFEADGVLDLRQVHSYDRAGRLSVVTQFDGASLDQLKLDRRYIINGSTLGYTQTNPTAPTSPNLETRSDWTYDPDSFRVLRLDSFNFNDEPILIETRDYDSEGRLITQTIGDLRGLGVPHTRVIDWGYDDEGRVETVETRWEKAPDLDTRKHYFYDEGNNISHFEVDALVDGTIDRVAFYDYSCFSEQ